MHRQNQMTSQTLIRDGYAAMLRTRISALSMANQGEIERRRCPTNAE